MSENGGELLLFAILAFFCRYRLQDTRNRLKRRLLHQRTKHSIPRPTPFIGRRNSTRYKKSLDPSGKRAFHCFSVQSLCSALVEIGQAAAIYGKRCSQKNHKRIFPNVISVCRQVALCKISDKRSTFRFTPIWRRTALIRNLEDQLATILK